MSLYTYKKERFTRTRRMAQIISYTSITIGALLLFWSFYPIASFWLYSKLFFQMDVKSPVPYTPVVSSLQQAGSILGSSQIYSSNLRDFVKADLWFPSKPQDTKSKTVSTNDYYLSIPKLNIQDAHVKVGGEDLSKSLVHYLPTSLPGQNGNVAIFGHSTLPQLYNVKDYTTIFTYLPSLQKGDTIEITMGEERYKYKVYDMFVVNPDQISVLEQKYDASYLTLVTCVPPGTFWKRLVVKAKIVPA